MGWEESMFAVFDDLEQQAAGLHLSDRDAEVADLTAAAYARIGLGSRLHASLDRELRVCLVGGLLVSGRLARVGDDWLLLVDQSWEWIVRHEAVATVSGLSVRADSEETWSVVDRLCGLAGVSDPCAVHLISGQRVEGRVGRVGRDFFELLAGDGSQHSAQVVPVHAVAALQGRPT